VVVPKVDELGRYRAARARAQARFDATRQPPITEILPQRIQGVRFKLGKGPTQLLLYAIDGVPELAIGQLQPRTAQVFIGSKQEVEPEYLVRRF
jgi:hypothetical protein